MLDSETELKPDILRQISTTQGQKNKKMIVFLIVLLVVAIYVILSLLFNFWPFERSAVAPTTETAPTTSSDPTAGWQTYRNAEYGFEFKYPREWEKIEYPDGVEVSPDDFGHNTYFGVFIDKRTLAEIKQQSENALRDNLISIKNITLNGLLALELSYIDSDPAKSIFLSQNGMTYRISLFRTPTIAADLDNILSTFKFIEPSSQLDTSGLKTYKNTQLGYELMYPETWQAQYFEDSLSKELVLEPPKPENFTSYFSVVKDTRTLEEIEANSKTYFSRYSRQEIPLGDYPAITYYYQNSRQVFLPYQGKIFLLGTDRNDLPEVKNIFQSFRFSKNFHFTQPVSRNIPSGWKEFINNAYDFSVQYPSFTNRDDPGPDKVFGVNSVGNEPLFYLSIYAVAQRKTDGVPCKEAAGGYYREYKNIGNIKISGQTYPKCIIAREAQKDQAIHISFNKNGKTWIFSATNYDKRQDLIDQIISSFEFFK